MSAEEQVTHRGGCHCGRVRFEVEAPPRVRVVECNCSICSASGFLHLIVSKDSFRLVAGGADLTSYRFGTGAANHLFCSICGVKSFYVPRSHPDGFSVNTRCLDEGTVEAIEVSAFDGANWEQNVAALREDHGQG